MYKRFLSIVFILILSASLVACSNNTKTAEIFESNASAINYLSGYWSDGKAEFFQAVSNDTLIVDYDFSYPNFEDADIMVIKNGVLYAAKASEDDELLSAEVIYFDYIDENSFKMTSAINDCSTILYREPSEIDLTNTDDEYVFWSMRHAGPFLEGDWTNKGDKYLSVRLNESGEASLSSNLDIPECNFVEFANYQLSAIDVSETGVFCINPLFELHIIDKDKISITDLSTETVDTFRRNVDDFSQVNDLQEAVFWDSNSAVSFLNGNWKTSDGKYFKLTLKDGKVSWNTDLPKQNTKSYQFNDNILVGYNTTSDGETNTNEMFAFTAISINELEIFDYIDSKTYNLTRVQN